MTSALVRRVAIASLALMGSRAAAAQTVQRSPLLLVARHDSVFVFIDSLAPRGHTWKVTRSDGTVIAEALEAETSPDRAAERLAEDLPLARRLTRADDPLLVLRRLQSDRTVAFTGLLYSKRIAEVTGRLAVDGAPLRSTGASYKAELVRRVDKSVRVTFTVPVRSASTPAAAATALEGRSVVEGVQLSWRYAKYAGAPEDLVIGFLVERATPAGGWTVLTPDPVVRDDARAPSFLDPDVADNTSYQYRVRPVLIGGMATEAGAPIRVLMRDRLAPLAPLDAAADVGDGQVRIVWALPPDADVRGYVIERRLGGGDTSWVKVTPQPLPATRLEYVDRAVRGGTIYAWRVRAIDAAGNLGPAATPVTARADERTPPDAPRALSAKLVPKRVGLYSWSAPIADDVVGYNVARGPVGGPMIRLNTKQIVGTTYADSAAEGAGLLPGAHYIIEVTAVDGSTNVSPAARIELLVPDDDPPEAPRAVAIRGRVGGSATITWTRSVTLDVASYEVAVTPEGQPSRFVGRTGGSGPFMLVDTAAADGARLAYAVVAVDTAGNRSPAATETFALIDEERPAAPRSIIAVRDALLARVRWERVASQDLAGYVVFRSTSLTGELTEVARTAVGEVEWFDRSAPPSAFYQVRAVDRAGNLSIASRLVPAVPGKP